MNNFNKSLISENTKQLEETISNRKELTERTLRMRALSYFAHIKAKLLTETIFEVEASKKNLQITNSKLLEQQKINKRQKSALEQKNTELMNTLKLLEQTRRDLVISTRFAASLELVKNIAHQWRQPLSSLLLMIHALKYDYLEKKVNDEYINTFFKSSTQSINDLSNIITKFQTLFQPNNYSEEFNIDEIIKNVLQLLNGIIEDNQIVVDFIPNTCFIKSYKNEISNVLFNLLNNSIYAIMNQQKNLNNFVGKIKIELKQDTSTISINIVDNGGGINKNLINKIFDPYISTKFQSQGIGLGLFMTKIVVERHLQGTITIINFENGTNCSLILPISIDSSNFI